MNNKGQVFSGILVLITLFMCGLSIGVYMHQQDNVQSSLVSPLAILELRDAKDVFEMREKELILSSLESVDSDFGSEEFLSEFRDTFILGVSEDMEKFIFSDWSINGRIVEDETLRDTFLKNVIYGEGAFVWEGSSSISFKRGKIEKVFEMRALDVAKTNFAVDFAGEFERKYLISKKSGKFFVEEA